MEYYVALAINKMKFGFSQGERVERVQMFCKSVVNIFPWYLVNISFLSLFYAPVFIYTKDVREYTRNYHGALLYFLAILKTLKIEQE